MNTMELYPTLEHCIETTARQEFTRLVADCLNKGDVDSEAEAKMEILHDFLQTADFGSLRQESAFYLILGEQVRFVLTDNGENLSCRLEVFQVPRLE
jgi:hypothetical protein